MEPAETDTTSSSDSTNEAPIDPPLCLRCNKSGHHSWTCPEFKNCPLCSNIELGKSCARAKSRIYVMRKAQQEGNIDQMRKILTSVKIGGHRPDHDLYLQLIMSYVKANELILAEAILDEMERDGITPRSVCVNAILNGWVDAQRLDEAMHLLNRAKRLGSKVKTITYNTLLKGLCSSGRVSDAMVLLTTMMNSEDKSIHPDSRTYNTILNSWCNSGKMEFANKLVKMMSKSGVNPDVITYNTLIKGYGRAGRPDRAEFLVSEMESLNLVPNERTYGLVVQAYCQNSQVHQAIGFLEWMTLKKNFPPSTTIYNIVIKGLVESGFFHQAEEVKRFIPISTSNTPLNFP